MGLIISILLYVLGAYCLISAASIFGVVVTIGQAAAVLVLFTLLVGIKRGLV